MGTPAQILPETMQSYAQQVLALEEKSAELASKNMDEDFKKIFQKAISLWVKVSGSVQGVPSDNARTAILVVLTKMLNKIDLTIAPEFLMGAVGMGLEMGFAQALEETGGKEKVKKPVISPSVKEALDEMPGKLEQQMKDGKKLLARAQTFSQVINALSQARKVVTTTERTARWATNESVNHSVRSVADQKKVPLLWIPERNACVHCLAYAGKVSKPGQDFPAGLTFGDKPLTTEKVKNPPLHPNCRCRVFPWRGSKRGVGAVDLPAALEREAQRSVLKGWSESTSNAERLRAADRLLQAGTNLPKTVQSEAKRAVNTGTFPNPLP